MFTSYFVGSGGQLYQVFDLRPLAYLEHCSVESQRKTCQKEKSLAKSDSMKHTITVRQLKLLNGSVPDGNGAWTNSYLD